MGEKIPRPLITLSSDFGPGNIGCGAMEAAVFEVCPQARVIHWCHTIPAFDVKDGAKMLEGVAKIPKGIHVCVVDPGVGTKRRGVAIQTGRGDFLIGPDNGVLRPAAQFLGGIAAVFELTDEKYRRHPVSPIFHGRDIFAPAAGHLAAGLSPSELGGPLSEADLAPSPYPEARWKGGRLDCEVIHINENGSVFLNIRGEEFEKRLRIGETLKLNVTEGAGYILSYSGTFGEVPIGKPLVLNDDFGRVELAVNQGNFAFTYGVKRGQKLALIKEGK